MRTVLAIVLSGGALCAQPQIDEATRAWLRDSVDVAKRTVGIVVGVIAPEGREFASWGAVVKGGARPDQDTIFEIGSITKVFTALLLADMVERGEVTLNDPVANYLPETVKVGSRNGREITLADLTTHTSGLPRESSNFAPVDLANPYQDYAAAQLYEFLSGHRLARDPGSQWEYSNLGVGLLGHALALRGMSYEALIRTRILDPLGMKNTTITLNPVLRARIATAHDMGLNPVPIWDFDALAGAGAIRSTADDMLTFAAAHMGLVATPLKAAMERMRAFRRPGAAPPGEQAMGWLVMKPAERDAFFHNGGTGGFHSALAVDVVNHRAAVVWVNSPLDVDLVAAHAMDPLVPLPTLKPARTETQLPEQTLASYVGVYQVAPDEVITITREGSRLFAQPTGESRLELFAEKEDEFFLKAVETQVSFERDAKGKVVRMMLRQNGQNIMAKRVE